jgi:hypothetical protein
MATRSDFTDDEWKILQRGLTGSGRLVSASDPSFRDAFGESKALARRLKAAHDSSPSGLVRDLAHVHTTGFGVLATPAEVEGDTIAALRAASEMLSARAPEDLEPYRRVVEDIADAVAEARGGVSDEEAAAIDRIKAAVG